MAIILNGTTHVLTSASLGASRPAAYSIATWWRADAVPSTTVNRHILSVGNSAAYPSDLGDLYMTWGHSFAIGRNRASIHTTGTTYVDSGTSASGASAGVWYHHCATYSAGALRFYQNGAQVGSTVAATVTAGSPANWIVSVGAVDNGASAKDAGKVCMVGYWDIALTAEDVAALGKGFAPRHVRPQSLRYFVPGLRDSNAVVGVTGTASNLTYDDDNPRIYA